MRKIGVYKVNTHAEVPVKIRGQLPPIQELQIGESLRFQLSQRRAVQGKASKLKQEVGMIFTVKKEDDEYARIWRIS
jgi:hypothetical protein